MLRRRVDLRQLPYGFGYLVAVAVVALTLLVAWLVSRGHLAPRWWDDYAVPVIYWSSPFLIALALVYRMRRMRKRQGHGSNGA